MPTEEELQRGFNLGDWEVLPGHGVLRRGDQEERPEPKVFAVLIALAKRDTDLVSREELIDEAWDGRPTSDEPIARCISQLRGHLGDRQKPHQLIETLQRRGYRLKTSVELHHPTESKATKLTETEVGPSPRMWRTVAAILALGFVAIAVYTWLRPVPPRPVPLKPPVPVRSIAVMPFANLSGNESDEYLVLGFKGELVQLLQGLDDYTVRSGQLSYEMETDKTAEFLGVEKVLLGTLRRSGDELKISYEISKDGKVVDGGDIEGTMEDLFALQESLALMVRDDLVGQSSQTLIKSRPSDSEAYDSYMRGVYALEHRGDPGNLEKAIELFQDAIRLDENYGPPYLMLATVYALLPAYRGAPLVEMDSLALQTIEAGIAADPKLAEVARYVWGYVYHKQEQWAKAEAAYERAINADVTDSNAFNWYSRMLASVGRLDDSLKQALTGLELDPDSPFLNSRVGMAYAWLGDSEKALEYYERANDLGQRGRIHMLAYAFTLMRTGQFENAQNLTANAVQMSGGSTNWVEPVFSAMADPGNTTKVQTGLEALNEASTNQLVSPQVEITVRTLFGDLDGAMRIAKLLEAPGEAFEMDMLFVPQFTPLRRHPDFMPLLDSLGVTEYWDLKGCIWDGDQATCPYD